MFCRRVTQSLSHDHDVITTIPEEEEMEVTTQQQQQQQSVPESLDRWLKFNDTLVEEFVFTDALLETECFGGAIKTSSSDPCMYMYIQYMYSTCTCICTMYMFVILYYMQ